MYFIHKQQRYKRKEHEGFTSTTGSGKPIHGGPQRSSSQVRIRLRHHLAKIYRQHISVLGILKCQTK